MPGNDLNMCTGLITVSFLLDMNIETQTTPNTKILKPKNIQKRTSLVESDVRHKPTPRQYTVYSVQVRYNREKHSGQKSHFDFFFCCCRSCSETVAQRETFRDTRFQRHIRTVFRVHTVRAGKTFSSCKSPEKFTSL